MAYHTARECFAQNLQMIGRPMADALNWNLNSGIDEFVTTVQQDLAAVHEKLDQILAALRRQR